MPLSSFASRMGYRIGVFTCPFSTLESWYARPQVLGPSASSAIFFIAMFTRDGSSRLIQLKA